MRAAFVRFVALGFGLVMIAMGGIMLFDSDASAKASRLEETQARLMSLRGGIAVFKIRTDRWPRSLEELVEARVVDRIPQDGWGRTFLWIRPTRDEEGGCLLSLGPDGRAGTRDDLMEGCDRTLLNQHLLVEAGLDGATDQLDAYGNLIRLVKRHGVTLAWSYGPDGEPDTADDQMARVARRER